jgi:hypothetical protein
MPVATTSTEIWQKGWNEPEKRLIFASENRKIE